jgi:hypothetical protein
MFLEMLVTSSKLHGIISLKIIDIAEKILNSA